MHRNLVLVLFNKTQFWNKNLLVSSGTKLPSSTSNGLLSESFGAQIVGTYRLVIQDVMEEERQYAIDNGQYVDIFCLSAV